MSRLASVFLVVLVLWAQAAGAVIDPRPDRLGVYFDQNADVFETFVGPAMPFDVHIILTNPSYAEVWGFEFGYTVLPSGNPSSVIRLFNSVPDFAIDLGDNTDPLQGDYIVGLAEPLPSTPAVVLVSWQLMILETMVLQLSTGPASVESIPDGLPAYEAGGIIVPLGLALGCWEDGAAWVNSECGLAVESAAFGAVKALYR